MFEDAAAAKGYVVNEDVPIVIKADGLAAGKGVVVANTMVEAHETIEMMLVHHVFGPASEPIVIEDCLVGSEISLFAICDGEDYVLLETAQDYKPAFDGDRGPNTGGMGTYSPYLATDDAVVVDARKRIIEPTLSGMREEGMPYKGILYCGLMLTTAGPFVIEFNVRFGDPEAQSILPRLDSDLLAILNAAVDGKLKDYSASWRPEHAVCVVAASSGYPAKYKKGHEITGLESAAAKGAKVFHAGTATGDAGRIVTNGGRVLGVTALGDTRGDARSRAYDALESIRFDGMQFRTDIAGGER